MKRYKVAIRTTVRMEAENEDEAIEKAVDQIEMGLIDTCDATELPDQKEE